MTKNLLSLKLHLKTCQTKTVGDEQFYNIFEFSVEKYIRSTS